VAVTRGAAFGITVAGKFSRTCFVRVGFGILPTSSGVLDDSPGVFQDSPGLFSDSPR
jgi:hypothetical protein